MNSSLLAPPSQTITPPNKKRSFVKKESGGGFQDLSKSGIRRSKTL